MCTLSDGTEWIEQARLKHFDIDALSSSPYCFYGRGIISSASSFDHGHGAVYIHYSEYQNGKTIWSEQAKLVQESDIEDDESDNNFGHWIAYDGDIIAVSANLDDDNGMDSGSVFIFQGYYDNWTQQQKLMPADGHEYQQFGQVVAIHDATLFVGTGNDNTNGFESGGIYLYKGTPDRSYWLFSQKLYSHDIYSNDRFGASMAMHEETLAVSAQGANNQGVNQGAIYIFSKIDQTYWSQQQKIIPHDIQDNVFFGLFLAMYKDLIAVGSPLDSEFAKQAGAVYIFRQGPEAKWSFQQKLYAKDIHTNHYFGTHVSIYGPTVVTGAFGDATFGSHSGAVYMFKDISHETEEPSDKRSEAGFAPTIKEVGWVQSMKIVEPGSTQKHLYFSDPVVHGPTLAIRNSVESFLYSASSDWSCLLVSLQDHFGDGWQSELKVTSPDGTFDVYHPTCSTSNPYKFRYCPALDSDEGVYHFSIPGGKQSKFFWEMRWTVQEEGSGKVHAGDHSTEMEFVFDKAPKNFRLRRISSASDQTCPGCGKAPPKIPPHKSSPSVGLNLTNNVNGSAPTSPIIGPATGEAANYDSSLNKVAFTANDNIHTQSITPSDEIDTPTSGIYFPKGVSKRFQPIPSAISLGLLDSNSAEASTKHSVSRILGVAPVAPPKLPLVMPKSPAMATYTFDTGYSRTLELTDMDASGWFRSDGSGTYYYISDVHGERLFTFGSLCEDVISKECPQALEDGHYLLRVGGGTDAGAGDHMWKFCGRTGGTQMQLEFIVAGRFCYPLLMFSIAAYCSKIDVPVAVLEGHFLFSGLTPDTTLTRGDELVIDSVTAAVVPGLHLSNIRIDGEKFDLKYGQEVVAFTACIPSTTLGFRGRSYEDMVELSDHVTAAIETAVHSGYFSSDIVRTSAVWTIDSNILTGVTSISLLDLTLVGTDSVRTSDAATLFLASSSSTSSLEAQSSPTISFLNGGDVQHSDSLTMMVIEELSKLTENPHAQLVLCFTAASVVLIVLIIALLRPTRRRVYSKDSELHSPKLLATSMGLIHNRTESSPVTKTSPLSVSDPPKKSNPLVVEATEPFNEVREIVTRAIKLDTEVASSAMITRSHLSVQPSNATINKESFNAGFIKPSDLEFESVADDGSAISDITWTEGEGADDDLIEPQFLRRHRDRTAPGSSMPRNSRHGAAAKSFSRTYQKEAVKGVAEFEQLSFVNIGSF